MDNKKNNLNNDINKINNQNLNDNNNNLIDKNIKNEKSNEDKKDIDFYSNEVLNSQNFNNFKKDIWNINKPTNESQKIVDKYKEQIDTSEFDKGNKKKREESPKLNTKEEIKDNLTNIFKKEFIKNENLGKKNEPFTSKVVQHFHNIIYQKDDDNQINENFEDNTNNIKKRVVNIDNNESDSDSNSDIQPNKNKKKQNNKKILNIYLNDNSSFENNIKYSINNTNKISNLNSKTNYNKYKKQLILDSEELNDNKHEFEKYIKNNEEYIEKNDENKSNNETKQFVKNNQLTIVNYNPKIERVFKKNLNENNRNKSILEMNVNFDNTDFFNPFDENLINKIIDKIKNGNEDENFEINNIKPPYEPKNFSKENNNNEQYAVKKLIKQLKKYINLLFEQFSKINIEFNNIAFCFILDCSLYLGIENKFIYLMIVLSILKIIQMFDIKFSILLTADDNFKVLIKKYDEKINYENLIKKLYETYILKRYRNNLLKSVQIAVEYIKCNNIENRLFWIFSDSLDDSILQFNYWKNKVLINKNNAFIFFIEKTHNIPESKQKFLTEAWNNFEKKANEQSISKIKVIQNVKSIDDFKDISEFINKLIFKENINKIIEQNKQKEIEINHFNEILNCDEFKESDKIYFFNNPKKIERNKINQISEKIELNLNNEKKDIPEIRNHI